MEPEKMKIEKGKKYLTRGGWVAECIWEDGSRRYCVHTVPEEHQKQYGYYDYHFTPPIYHESDGRAGSILVVNEPPSFFGHPADIVSEIE